MFRLDDKNTLAYYLITDMKPRMKSKITYKGALGEMPRVTLSFACPIEMANRVVAAAHGEELTLSQYIRKAVKAYIEEQ